MKRREFISGLGSAAAAWPVVPAHAQQNEQVRRIGVLMAVAESDQNFQSWIAAFAQELQKLGWTNGHNVRIDYRWGRGEIDRVRTFAAELVGLRPDVLFAPDTPSVAALKKATPSIPIVFALIADPIGGGFVASLARPAGNVTGFVPVEPPMAGKWLQILTQIAPQVGRVAFLYNPDTAPYAQAFFRYAEAAAIALKVELIAAPVYNEAEFESVVAATALSPNGGLIVMPEAFAGVHRKQIINLAARRHVPTIYPYRYFVDDGGLISYGNNLVDNYRLAASYVDRILRGERPVDLPVQAPTRYETVINLKTAKALGLEIPQTLLATADEVIQ